MAKDRVDTGRGRRAEVVKKKSKGGSKSMKPFYAVLVLFAIVGTVALAYVTNRPQNAATTVDPNLATATDARGYTMGNPNAPVKVIEFADFECPACAQFATLSEPDIKKRLIDAGIVSYTFHDFPLSIHRNTWQASNAAACADEQGKFWEMHDQLFNLQDQWNGQATRNPKSQFESYARALGLNVDQWETCYDSKKYEARIKASEALALKSGAGQTPTFIIGTKMVPGAIGFDKFKAYVDSALALAPRDSAAKAPAPGDTAAKAAVPTKGS